MTENIIEIISEMKSCTMDTPELEEKEFFALQELCGLEDPKDISIIVNVLAECGTILAIPILCGLLKEADVEVKQSISNAIEMIKIRAKARGSFLPDEFFTPEHWRPEWLGSNTAFLTYVQVIADVYIKYGFDESEVNRIGQILTEEMDIDIAPYHTFADFKACQTDWDHDKEYKIILEKIAEEKLLDDLEKEGISESDISFLKSTLMDLQYDYLVARLKLKGNLEFYRFMLKVAESLNHPDK